MFKSMISASLFAVILAFSPIIQANQIIRSEGVAHSVLVNVNTASAEELEQFLVGVGPERSKAIVEFREKYGEFHNLENLLEIDGIGEGIIEKNRDRIEF